MAAICNFISLTALISLLLLVRNVNSISFRFPTFDSNYSNAITFEGDAFVSSQGFLQLTNTINGGVPVPQPNSAGRASYSKPIRLWDAETGKVADFSTSFSFVLSPASHSSSGLFGDGISFFIAPFNSHIPSNSSGGFLGLFSGPTALNSYANRIVAVELDTFSNLWDPPTAHIGVNVNSIASVKTSSWNVEKGFTGVATVSYDPEEKSLNVLVRYPESKLEVSSELSVDVDLRAALPEWVRVGFSGATGEVVEIHSILSWDFLSSDFY